MEDKELSLTLTVAEVNLVLGALGELPLKVSVALWQKVKAQAETRMQEEPASE